MGRIKKLFGGIDFNLKKTILFSLAVGVFCGIFGGLPILKDSSFTDMAGGYEFWVISAVIICVNSKNFYKAGINCFLYFLITQPLQFYLQAFLYSHEFEMAFLYFKMWLPVIVLTLPGGMVAYFSKKQNILGATILGIGNTIEAISFAVYLTMFLTNPPKHLLSSLVSIASIFIMSFALQEKKLNRLIAIGLAVILFIVVLIYLKLNGLYLI